MLSYQLANDFYLSFRVINISLSLTIPISCTVVMYFAMVWIVKRKRKQNTNSISSNISTNFAESMDKRMTLMVQRVVICLLVCYIPFIVWRYYQNAIQGYEEIDYEKTTVEVKKPIKPVINT